TLRQPRITSGRYIQKVEKALKMRREFKQPQGMSKGRRVHNNMVILLVLQQFLDCQQSGNLGHSRQRCVQQGRNLFSAEQRSTFHNVENRIAVSRQEFLELLFAVNLPG